MSIGNDINAQVNCKIYACQHMVLTSDSSYKQAGAELGQAQLKLVLGFALIK